MSTFTILVAVVTSLNRRQLGQPTAQRPLEDIANVS